MPFKKGKSGNPAGRPAGTPNRTTAQIKELITDKVLEGLERINFDELTPKETIELIVKLTPFVVSKPEPEPQDDWSQGTKVVIHDIREILNLERLKEENTLSHTEELGG